MREVFDHAYEGFLDLLIGLTDLTMRVVGCVCMVFVYLTIPLWGIPYAIYRKRERRRVNRNE